MRHYRSLSLPILKIPMTGYNSLADNLNGHNFGPRDFKLGKIAANRSQEQREARNSPKRRDGKSEGNNHLSVGDNVTVKVLGPEVNDDGNCE